VSPWTVDELLAKAPADQLRDLLNFKGSDLDGPDRNGLAGAIREAAKKRLDWAFALMDSLAEQEQWESDLWPSVLRGSLEAELTKDNWLKLLEIASERRLVSKHAHDVASIVFALVRDGGKPFALELIEKAEAVAKLVWELVVDDEQPDDDWLSRAINRPAGVVVEFWIHDLSLQMKGKTGADRVMPERFKQWFTAVVQEPGVKGGFGRSILASQLAFLTKLDEAWAREMLVPMFTSAERGRFEQAWDGFLVWGRLLPDLDDVLVPAFLAALPRLGSERRERFIEFYTALAVFHVDDPTQQLLPALFQRGPVEDRVTFATQVGHFLRQMQPAAKRQLWERWLGRYWRDRMQAVPAVLDEREIRQMLDWVADLGDLFPEAASLAARMPAVRIEHSHLLSELEENDLVVRYPQETAELLIYLCACVVGYQRTELRTVAGRLPDLPADLRRRLDEALARL
jgi:hypothetical protein